MTLTEIMNPQIADGLLFKSKLITREGAIPIKNPNHYGTVTKLSGNRRKPYIVKEGVSGLQKPIGVTLLPVRKD